MTAVIQIDVQQLRIAINAMCQFQRVWNHKRRSTYDAMTAIVHDIFEGNIQRFCNDLIVAFHPQWNTANTTLDDFITRCTALLERIEAADVFHSNTCIPVVPPPRIYLINGINSTEPDGMPSESMLKLKQLLESETGIPDVEIVVVPAIYNTDINTNYADLYHAIYGLDSPLDALSYSFLAGVDKLHYGVNTLIGAAEVVGEYTEWYPAYTTETLAWIKEYEKTHPLAPDQTTIVMGHSGGGAVAANLATELEVWLGHDVSTVVTMGSPLVDAREARAHANVIQIRNWNDLLVTNPFIDDITGINDLPVPYGPPLFPTGSVIPYNPFDFSNNRYIYTDDLPSIGAHSSYLSNPQTAEVLEDHIPELAPFMNPDCLEAEK